MSEDKKQLLHLVIGGELEDLKDVTFRNLDEVDIVGVYPSYEEAAKVWKQKAQMTVEQCAYALFRCAFAPFARSKASHKLK